MNTFLSTTYGYDIAGNVLSKVDPKNNRTTLSYADPNNTYAHATSVQNALQQTTTMQYEFWSGKLAQVTDPNGVSANYFYNDPLERLTEAIRAAGTAAETRTSYAYPNPTTVVQAADQSSPGDGILKTQTLYDGLGRSVEMDTYESASQYIATTQTYDALGRLASTTNPSRQGDGLNYSTIYLYDALGRTIQVQTADGSATTNSYWGTYTTITDPAGKARVTATDALGRIIAVWEDPNGFGYQTGYLYDVLDDLVVVGQSGQNRTFAYDSLKRLTQATNPESGTTNYGYDNNSNLSTKTDARNITTAYQYDSLNRLQQKSYSDGTPTVNYAYDRSGVSNSVGRLTQASNSAATINYTGYDPLGRVTGNNQQAAGQTYSLSYSYNLAGSVTSETYPSGRVVATGYDGANRVSQVAGTLGGQTTNYVSSVSYAPQGAPYTYRYGNTLWPGTTYNSRLQPTQVYGTLNSDGNQFMYYFWYNWGGTNNNGNVQSIDERAGNAVPWGSMTDFGQSFSYDGVNRLTSVSDSGGYSRTFGYDAFGNSWVTGVSGIGYGPSTPASNVYNGNNQIGSSPYDAAGNMLALPPSYTFTYDAENRQISETNSGTPSAAYSYDSDGQRVGKTVTGSGTTVFVYDAFGDLAVEYSPAWTISKEYIRFGGQIAAIENAGSAPCQTCYLSYDHLGSVRMVTDQNGNLIARHDFLPFGDEIPGGWVGRDSTWGPGTDNVNQKFTGQERDAETGLDFFQARYYTSGVARFMSPDPENAGADLTNPQSWNGYSYVSNNPMNSVDPTGLSVAEPSQGGPCFVCGFPGGPSGGRLFWSMSAQWEQQYAQLANGNFYGNLAYKYASSGDIKGAQHIADLSGGTVQISDVSATFLDQTSHWTRITEGAAVVGGTAVCVAAEPCGLAEILFGVAFIGSVLLDRPLEYHVPPKALPGFPDSVRVKPVGGRARWKTADGKIAEWDSQHGKVEVYDKTGKRHLGEYDPNTGQQTKPPNPGRTTPK